MTLALDAHVLYGALKAEMAARLQPHDQLVGVASGGAWLAQALARDLNRPVAAGVISSSMHRDDFAKRGLSAGAARASTSLPFEINGASIWLIDDVLFTGRTIRAVLNELYDFGRPTSVRLAVLVDRGGRELPFAADWAAARVSLPAEQSLSLSQRDDGCFSFSVKE